MWSVTPQLSERRGYCSLRQNNRTDGHAHPHPPPLESNMGQAKACEETQDRRQTDQTGRKRKRRTESEKKHNSMRKKSRKSRKQTDGDWVAILS